MNKLLIILSIIIVITGITLLIVYTTKKKTPPGPTPPGPTPPGPTPPGPTPPTPTGTPSFNVYFAPAQTKNKDSKSKYNACSIDSATCTGSCKTSKTSRSNCIMGSGRDPQKNLQTELDLISTVTAACAKDKKNPYIGQNINNPYKIKYSVYNLMLSDAITGMISAVKAGVYVQVLIEGSQTNPCLTYNTALQQFKDAGLDVPCWAFNPGDNAICGDSSCPSSDYTCNEALSSKCNGALNTSAVINGGTLGDPTNNQDAILDTAGGKVLKTPGPPSQWSIAANNLKNANDLNFLPIISLASEKSYAGIMHTKMRLFEWKSGKNNYNAVISGSLNPDPSALQNEETIFVIQNHPIYNDYDLIYKNILNLTNKYTGTPYINKPAGRDQTQNLQLLFSKGNIQGGVTIGSQLNKLISETTDMVLIFVYTMRDYGGLVASIQKAAKNGAFVAVMTDIDQMVGEPGFGAPDGSCLPAQINSIKLDPKYGKNKYVPVYACKNINGTFTAFHHKNMVVGVEKMYITTDTANWTNAGVGGTYDPPNSKELECSRCECCGNGDKSCEIKESYQNNTDSSWGTGNASSSVANCETTLFIDSQKLDKNKLGVQFADVFFYLIAKYWEFTINNISKITQEPLGTFSYNALFPNATLTKNSYKDNSYRLVVPTGQPNPPNPSYEVIPHVYTPDQIGAMMLNIPGLGQNKALKTKITALSKCTSTTKYGICSK